MPIATPTDPTACPFCGAHEHDCECWRTREAERPDHHHRANPTIRAAFGNGYRMGESDAIMDRPRVLVPSWMSSAFRAGYDCGYEGRAMLDTAPVLVLPTVEGAYREWCESYGKPEGS